MDWLASAIAEEQKLPNDSVLMEAALDAVKKVKYPEGFQSFIKMPSRGQDSLSPLGLIAKAKTFKKVLGTRIPLHLLTGEFNGLRKFIHRSLKENTKEGLEGDLPHLTIPQDPSEVVEYFSRYADNVIELDVEASRYIAFIRNLRKGLGSPSMGEVEYRPEAVDRYLKTVSGKLLSSRLNKSLQNIESLLEALGYSITPN